MLSNILVGEVWLASGQSNMEYSMNNHPHHARPKKGDPEVLYKEFKAADSPIIRTMYVECSNNGEILPTAGWKMLSEESLALFLPQDISLQRICLTVLTYQSD